MQNICLNLKSVCMCVNFEFLHVVLQPSCINESNIQTLSVNTI